MVLLNPTREIAEGIVVVSSANYDVDVNDHCIFVTTGNSDRTIKLPSPLTLDGNQGMRVFAKKIDSGSGDVILDAATNGSTIDGSNTMHLADQYAGVELVSDGVEWFCVNDSRSAKTAGHTGDVTIGASTATFNNGILVSIA